MRRYAAVLAISGLMFASGALAATATAAPPREHAHKQLQILSLADIDPTHVLPPPPADGSAVQTAELALVQHAYGSRTPAQYAQAQSDNDHEDLTVFDTVLGERFDLAKLPATAALLGAVVNDESIFTGMAKRAFRRQRPWAADPSIKPCDYKPGADPLTSYPSGHAALGYATGYVLAALMPDKAQAILGRAREYAENREVCGDHYPSDLEASHVLATAVTIKLLASPKAAPMFDAAEAELRAAGLAP